MRHIYIDAGANWANTLRLFRDLSPAAASEPWEVYAFEASPLILPFLEEFTRWLSSGRDGTAPTSCLPTSGSTDDFVLVALALAFAHACILAFLWADRDLDGAHVS